MSPLSMFPRLTTDPGVKGGALCIRDTGIPLNTVSSFISDGYSVERIRSILPVLEEEDLRQVRKFGHFLIEQYEPPHPCRASEIPKFDEVDEDAMEMYRRMGPAGRLRLIGSDTATFGAVIESAVREMHPDWDEPTVWQAVDRRVARAQGW